MAENCIKTLKELGMGAKVVLWSHNFHIYHSGGLDTQGNYLKEKLGNDYYALISLCNEGKFNAFLWDRKTEQTKGFHTFNLTAANDSTYEYMFALTKWPLAIFNIQKVKNQATPQKDRFKEYTVREIGSVFTPDDPEAFEHQDDLFNRCEGVIWINTVTAATSLWHRS
jgi:erythromycin esterase-like protein